MEFPEQNLHTSDDFVFANGGTALNFTALLKRISFLEFTYVLILPSLKTDIKVKA
jgi:hypothetical protein